MPARRVYGEGSYAHYVTFSCYKRRKLLKPDTCTRIVLGCLAAQLRRQNAVCAGFCIMPDHVHAIIWFWEEHRISLFMNKWKDVSSLRIAATYARDYPEYWSKLPHGDPVWQDRYYDFNIHSELKLGEKLEYMHNNPVKAGFVSDACAWPWSSARFWLQGKSVGVPIAWPGQRTLKKVDVSLPRQDGI